MNRWKVRPTGVSAFGGGAQWEFRPSDGELARGVLAFLEDRRILWEDMRYEFPDECLKSAEKTREYLTSVMQTPGIGTSLEQALGEVRQLFTAFMMEERRHSLMRGGPYGPDELSVALGSLRAAVGERLAQVSSEFDLAIGRNLQSILPDSGRWFFEPFSGGE